MHFLKWTDYLKRLSEQRCVCLHCICSESFLATDLLSIWKIGNVKSPPVPGWMGFDMRSAALKMFPGRCKTHSPKNLQTKYTWAVWRANTITHSFYFFTTKTYIVLLSPPVLFNVNMVTEEINTYNCVTCVTLTWPLLLQRPDTN